MRSLFADELTSKLANDPRIKLITCDLGFGVFEQLSQNYPENYLNLGITEQASMSIAAGLAAKGHRPFIYSIANFPTFRCFEQIRNDVRSMNLPVTIVSVGAGLGYAKAGYSHFAVEDISAIRSLDIAIYNPSDAEELKESINQILRQARPAYLRLGGKIPIQDQPLGKTVEISRSEIVLAYSGDIKSLIIEAEKILTSRGYRIRVVSLPYVNESDIDDFLNSAPQNILTIEEHVLTGGFSSMILERVSDLGMTVNLKRIGIRKLDPHLVGSQSFLREKYGLTVENIVNSAMELTKFKL